MRIFTITAAVLSIIATFIAPISSTIHLPSLSSYACTSLSGPSCSAIFSEHPTNSLTLQEILQTKVSELLQRAGSDAHKLLAEKLNGIASPKLAEHEKENSQTEENSMSEYSSASVQPSDVQLLAIDPDTGEQRQLTPDELNALKNEMLAGRLQFQVLNEEDDDGEDEEDGSEDDEEGEEEQIADQSNSASDSSTASSNSDDDEELSVVETN